MYDDIVVRWKLDTVNIGFAPYSNLTIFRLTFNISTHSLPPIKI